MNSNTLVCGKAPSAPSGEDWYHIYTSQFTCSADQLAGFVLYGASFWKK